MVTVSLEDTSAYERAFVFGLGGGGDVVGAIPTARLFEMLGLEVVLGGTSWEPVPRDVRPGPRPLEELLDVEAIASHVARATPTSRTVDEVPLAEAGVAAHVEEEVFVLDVADGPTPLAASLAEVVEARGIDLVVGVDAGGDAIGRGTEPNIQSPLTDAIGLIVLEDVGVDSLLGVIGYGSDGELTREELEGAIATLAGEDALLGAWGITPAIRRELEAVLADVATEASRLPVEAAAGAVGPRTIRGGEMSVEVSPASAVTLYFDPAAVASRSVSVDVLRGADSLEVAAAALGERGIQTEFDTERRRLRR